MSTPFSDVKFNGKNYEEWSVTVRMILRGLGLIHRIDGTFRPPPPPPYDLPNLLSRWRAEDNQAMAVISQSVEIDFRLSIAGLPTALAMWEHLSRKYNKKQSRKFQSSRPSMKSRLFEAARSGNVAELRQLYAEVPNPLNSSTPHGNTALHLAVIFRQDEFAKELCLMCPSLLSAANGDGNTPLLLAAALGIQSIVKSLIASPASTPRDDLEEGELEEEVEEGELEEEGTASPAFPRGDLEEGELEEVGPHPIELEEEGEAPPLTRSRRRGRAPALAPSFYNMVMETEMEMDDEVEIPSSGRATSATVTLWHSEWNHMLRATNKMGNNALHEALRNGHVEVALVLLRAEPELARRVNNNGESPLYMACYRGLEVVVGELLGLGPTATHKGPKGQTALHSAVMVGHSGLLEALLEKRPGLAKEATKNGGTPLHYASRFNKLEVVKLLLVSDPSLAYVVDKNGNPPITWAVTRGYVRIVEEFVRLCPDSALMASNNGNTLLHIAVYHGSVVVVNYILRTPELQGLINQPNCDGEVPLHIAVRECNKKTLRALLACKSLDKEAVNKQGQTAVDVFFSHPDLTLRRVSTRKMLTSAFPNHHRFSSGRRPIRDKKTKNQTVTPLIHGYFNNSILVATLMATITFAAAFTVPGGYDGNQGSPDEGLPILARKAAFKAFLISNTIAMCASLAVAFFCILAPWVDDDFLIRYVDKTRCLLFCGFAAMSVAFATGLYAVVAPGNLWLAVVICVLCCSLPLVTFLIGEWIVYGERLKLLMSTNLNKIKEKIVFRE